MEKETSFQSQVFAMLKDAPINFVGNVESRDLLQGVADVVVCDGFTGNVALKSLEGTALALFSMLKEQLMSSFTSKLAAAVLKPKLMVLKDKMDYSEYGGAALFGLKAPVIKAHGSSNDQSIFSAIRQTREMVAKEVIPTISSVMEKESPNKRRI